MAKEIELRYFRDKNGKIIAPFSPEAAIYDESGKRLSDKLKGIDFTKVQEAQENAIASIEEASSGIYTNTGVSEYPDFSPSKSYEVGDVVRYNGILKEFTVAHPAGAWIGSDTKDTSIKKKTDENVGSFERSVQVISNAEYKEVQIDSQGRIIEAIKNKDHKRHVYLPTIFEKGIEAPQIEDLQSKTKEIEPIKKVTTDITSYLDLNEFIEVHIDANGKILYGVKKTGEFYMGKLPQSLKKMLENNDKLSAEYKELIPDAINKLRLYESYKGQDLLYNGLNNPTVIKIKTQEEFELLPSQLMEASDAVRVLIYEGVYNYSGIFIEKTDEVEWNNIEIIGVGNVKIIGSNKQVSINDADVSLHKTNYSIPFQSGFDRNVKYYNGNDIIQPTNTENLTGEGFFESEIHLIKVKGKITGYTGQSGETIKVIIGLEYNKKDSQSGKDYTFDFVSTGSSLESFKSDLNDALMENGFLYEEQQDGSILISKSDGSKFSESSYMIGLSFINETCINVPYIIHGFVYIANNVLNLPSMSEDECKDAYIQIYKDYDVCMQNVLKITDDKIYIAVNTVDSDESYPLAPTQYKGDRLRIRLFNLKGIDNEPLMYNERIYLPYYLLKLQVLDSESLFFKYSKKEEDKGTLKSLLISNISFVGGNTCIKINHVVSDYIGIEKCRFTGYKCCADLNYSSNIRIVDNSANKVSHLLNGKLINGVAVVLRNSVSDTIYRNTGGSSGTAHAINVSPESGWIAFNKLKNCYGGGFNFSLGEAGFYSIDGKLPTIIENNEVYFDAYAAKNRYKYGFGDVGGIYTYVNNYWLLIRRNYVHNLVGYRDDAIMGIYIDGGASNVVIYGNLVLDCNRGINLYVPSGLDVKKDTDTGLLKYASRSRFIMANIINNLSKLEYNSIYDNNESMNGGNIVVYDTKKPDISYVGMGSNETYLPYCKVSETGILSIPLEYLSILLNFDLSKYITEKINNKYNG